MLEPVLAAVYPLPRLALFPVMILIFGLGARSETALVAAECFFPIAYNTVAGGRGIERAMLWAAHNAGAGTLRIWRDVMLPSCLPPIMTGLRTAVPIMLVVVTVAEMLSGSVGIGYVIRSSVTEFAPEQSLAVIIFLAVIGFLLDRGMVALTRKVASWERRVTI